MYEPLINQVNSFQSANPTQRIRFIFAWSVAHRKGAAAMKAAPHGFDSAQHANGPQSDAWQRRGHQAVDFRYRFVALGIVIDLEA